MEIEAGAVATSGGEEDEVLARIRNARPTRAKKSDSAKQKRYIAKLNLGYAITRAQLHGVDVLGVVEDFYPIIRRKAA